MGRGSNQLEEMTVFWQPPVPLTDRTNKTNANYFLKSKSEELPSKNQGVGFGLGFRNY